MESILLKRLSMFSEQIQTLTDKALILCQNASENNEDEKIISSKLQSVLHRFSSELNNYFNLSKEHNVQEISEMTETQLKGEDVLAELNARIAIKTVTISNNKDNSPHLSSRLPKLDLPEFSGDILHWHQFWDQFNSNIHQRNLHDVDKLLYLKASLNGQAKTAIEGLETTNKNYQIAISTLKERYGRESQIIDAHYAALYKIKPAENSTDYRITLNEIERHLRVLSSLGEDTNHNHLRFLVMEKFPGDIIYEMKMKMTSESITDMRKQLGIIISAREDANRTIHERNQHKPSNYTIETFHVKDVAHTKEQNRKAKTSFHNFKSNNNENITQRFKTNYSASKKGSRPFKRPYETRGDANYRNFNYKRRNICCIFCQGSHFNDKCTVVKTIGERKFKLGNKCYNCLKGGHIHKVCDKKRICVHCKQVGLHNRALCPRVLNSKHDITHTLHVKGKSTTVLQTAIVEIEGRNVDSIKCRALLDSGSQRSYVTQKIAKDLNLPIEEETHLTVFTFGSKTPQELDSPLVKLKMRTRTNTSKILFANVVPTISHGVPYSKLEPSDWNDERHTLADDGSLSDRVDILIGNDYYHSLLLTGKKQIRDNLFLVESELGMILSGKTENKPIEQMSVVTYFQSSCENKLNEPDPPLDNGNLQILWDLESIGITDSPKISRDEEAIKQFNENTKYVNNRYQVAWPWVEYPPSLPSNFGLAYGRLANLLKRMDSKSLASYNDTLKEQLHMGIIEPVPLEQKVNHPVHYLPHHGVTVPGKPIRIVYDASAKTKDNKSLNQCLYCGPMMLEDLTGLLIKFRCHPIGISADVEKAFLQLSLQEQDRDVTRFLWVKDTTKTITEDNLLHLRFTRVPFGVISSPFLLNATIRHHLLNSNKSNIRNLANDIYVDNIVTGVNSTQKAISLYENSKEAFQDISMNLREWSSNSKDFMRHVPDTCADKVVKILGLNWHLKEDTLHLRIKDSSNANTKRGVLKTIASIYDPCGVVVPSLVPAKLLLQDLWKIKIKWDAPLSMEMTDKWRKIQNDLEEIKDISLPRYYLQDKHYKECQIHCFSDSSLKSYAAVVYIVAGSKKSFVIGKSRLVPIKDQANLKIPRLELLGTLIGSRLIQYVLKFIQFNVTHQTLWTDSQIVIDWYNSNKLLNPFVSRRIEEIKRNKNLTVRYVPSEMNPADVATRPICDKGDLQKWLSGPDFLLKQPSEWPTSASRVISFSVGEGLSNSSKQQEISDVDRTTNSQEVQKDNNQTIDNTLQQIKKIQSEYYTNETEGKETNLSRNLGLFKDIDGILRCKGRLKNADWSFDKRYPVLIPKDCEFTRKIITDLHERNYHVGVNHTLSIVRQSYWIPQGKSYVQKILRKCPSCVKHSGGPFKLPHTPALPHERVNFSTPFSFAGVDYMGPVLVKTENGTRKRWICLFTCLAVRAIHLEVVQDLTSEEALLALRRMISTRGIPVLITSDNALNFKLLADVLSKPYCVENKIQWKFIPELAPWFGGFYERMVAMVKNCMGKTLHKHLLKDSQLITIIKEIEAVINTRPLTCVDTELEHILTPSDFLNMGRSITMDTSIQEPFVLGTTTKTDLVKSWKRSRVILEEFKEMFCNRYLPSLRERYRHSHKEPHVTSKEKPKIGQIVQIKGDKNRVGWKVGKIISLVHGSDGLCRVAKVKVGKTIFTRSIAHLYPLEIEDAEGYYINEHERRQETTGSPTIPIVPNETMKNTINRSMEETDEVKTTPFENNLQASKITNENESTDLTNESMNNENESVTEMADDTELSGKEKADEEKVEQHKESRQRRNAAVQALEKIREWTHNLITIL